MTDTRAQIEQLLNKSISHQICLMEYFERQDGILWCLCETQEEEDFHIFRVEGHSVDQWASYLWRVDAEEKFNDIIEEFSSSSEDELPGDYQVESDKLKSVELSTLEKINNSKFGKFGHTLIDESTITIATMEEENTGKKYHLFIEGEEVRDTLENCAPSASVAEMIDTIIHLLNKTDLLDCGRYYYEEGPFPHWDKMSRTEKILSVYDLFIKSSNKDEALALVCSPFFKHMTQDSESCEARGSLDYLIDILKR